MTEPAKDQSSLLITVPDSEPLVASFRSRFDLSAERGLPAHITILWPFADPDDLSGTMMRDLHLFFAGQSAFEYQLSGLCGFRDVIYLAPSPMNAFINLTRATTARFPKYPPYGGAFENPIPHLTIAQSPPAEDLGTVCREAFAAIGPHLPLRLEASAASLAIKRDGRWSVAETFPFGS